MSRQVRAKEPGLSTAIAASIIFHLAVVGFAYRYSFNADDSSAVPSAPDQNRPSIEVIFAERAPQQSSVQDQELLEENTDKEVEVEITDQVLTNSGLSNIPIQLVRLEQDQVVTISNGQQAETDQATSDLNQGDPSSVSEGISSAELNASLNSFIQSYRQDINKNWLEECARFKNQYVLEECPHGQDYVATLNPVRIQTIIQSEPLPLAPGEFSARESFELINEGDLFNPYLLSNEIALLGTGGGIINNTFAFLANTLGITQPNMGLLISVEMGNKNEEEAAENNRRKRRRKN